MKLRSGLLSLAGQNVAAETSFVEALRVAQAQGARGYELRAANGLARLWKNSGRGSKVRPLIQPLIAQFTSGFSTPDLDDARALLAGVD